MPGNTKAAEAELNLGLAVCAVLRSEIARHLNSAGEAESDEYAKACEKLNSQSDALKRRIMAGSAQVLDSLFDQLLHGGVSPTELAVLVTEVTDNVVARLVEDGVLERPGSN